MAITSGMYDGIIDTPLITYLMVPYNRFYDRAYGYVHRPDLLLEVEEFCSLNQKVHSKAEVWPELYYNMEWLRYL